MKLTREDVYQWDNAITDLLYEMDGNEDYLKGAKDFLLRLTEKRLLNCKHQIGDDVDIRFSESNSLNNCEIIKVHFTKSKTLYDVAIKDGDEYITRLYNLDSVFIKSK